MPIYEYVCTACGHEFDEIQKFSDKPIRKCPECSKLKVEKKVSLSGFQLKGGGWYADGYSTSGDKKAEKTEKKDAKKNDQTKKAPAKSKPKASAKGAVA